MVTFCYVNVYYKAPTDNKIYYSSISLHICIKELKKMTPVLRNLAVFMPTNKAQGKKIIILLKFTPNASNVALL